MFVLYSRLGADILLIGYDRIRGAYTIPRIRAKKMGGPLSFLHGKHPMKQTNLIIENKFGTLPLLTLHFETPLN